MGHLLYLRPGILLLQETKIVDEQKVVEAKAWCLARIMNIPASQSTSSAKDGENTDTDIAWSRHLDVAAVPKTWFGDRLVEVAVRTAYFGVFYCYSVHGWKSRTSPFTVRFSGLC